MKGGGAQALTGREGGMDVTLSSFSLSVIHVKVYFKQENDLSKNDMSAST